MKFPRLFGLMIDGIHMSTWGLYLSYLRKEGVKVVSYGKSQFLCSPSDAQVVDDALFALEERDSDAAKFLSERRAFCFIVKGSFPDNARVANFSFLIHRNNLSYGVDGLLSVIGYAIVLEETRLRSGNLKFRLFPPDLEETKKFWIAWMNANSIRPDLIEFYQSIPLKN